MMLQHVSSLWFSSGFAVSKLHNLSLLKVWKQVVMSFCGRRGSLWHSNMFHNVLKVVLCGKRNSFASLSKDELQFTWQAQHFEDLHHRHSAWQLQHFRRVLLRLLCQLHCQGCLKRRQRANSVAGVACCDMRWHSALHTLQSTLYTPHSTHYTSHSTLYTLHSTLHTLYSTLHTLHSTLHTPHSALHTLHSTLCTSLHFSTLVYTSLHFTLHTLRSTLSFPHSTLHTLHFTLLHTPHFTLHTSLFTLYTPHFTLCTLHSTLLTLHSRLYTLHLLYTLHFTLHIHTLHSSLYTLHSTLSTAHLTLYTPHSTIPTSHYTEPFATQHSTFFTPHTLHSTLFRFPQSTVHWYGNMGNMYKTVQTTCFTKVFYVTAFGFVVCILFCFFLQGISYNHPTQK